MNEESKPYNRTADVIKFIIGIVLVAGLVFIGFIFVIGTMIAGGIVR